VATASGSFSVDCKGTFLAVPSFAVASFAVASFTEDSFAVYSSFFAVYFEVAAASFEAESVK
jgi:hypothetical protein